MAFAYTAALQARISLAVFNCAYARLDSTQKIQLDLTWSSGALAGGAAYDAYIAVSAIAQWFEQAASTPDLSFPEPTWDRLFIAKAAMILVKTVRPDRLADFSRDHEAALDEAIDTYSPTLINSATISGQPVTVDGIRKFVANHCIRRKESGVNQGLRRRIFPPIADIDAHLQWTLVTLWNLTQWSFRARLIQITINANNSVTMTGLTGETFDAVASNRFYFDSSNAGAVLEWVDKDSAPALKAMNGTTTGMPRFFRTELNGATVTWHLFPIPDQAYTLYGTVYVATPTLTALSDINTAITKFPAEFGPGIRDLVLARVLMAHNASDGQKMWKTAMDQIEVFFPAYTDSGAPARQTSVGDVYGDFADQMGGGYGGAYGFY